MLKLFPKIPLYRGRGLAECVCVCVNVEGWECFGKKGGQLCWKLSLPCAFAPFILGSKRCVCVHVRVNVSECLCVFVGNRADFRALGIGGRDLPHLSLFLHICSIGREEKIPVCSERCGDKQLRDLPVFHRLQGTLMGV